MDTQLLPKNQIRNNETQPRKDFGAVVKHG